MTKNFRLFSRLPLSSRLPLKSAPSVNRIAGAWAIGLFLALTPRFAHAAKFANQFVEFEMPPQWQCTLEGAEWVCQNTVESKKREAIIVLAAKLKGDQDSLDQYLTYLKAAKTYTSVQGKPVKSEVKYAKTDNLNGDPWVDSLHLESELPGFYTRYLATVKKDIGVLVTYSIVKSKYQQYQADFEAMTRTLKVFRKEGAPINVRPADAKPFDIQMPAGAISEGTVNPNGGSDSPIQVAAKQNKLPLLPIILVAAVVFFIWRRKRSD